VQRQLEIVGVVLDEQDLNRLGTHGVGLSKVKWNVAP
jgi:hypothetical protein